MLRWIKEQLVSEVRQNARRYDLIISLLTDQAKAINKLTGKVEEFMATQEERLQAILAAVKTVKQMLIDLKTNNPNIEDEISAIEAELDITKSTEEPPQG